MNYNSSIKQARRFRCEDNSVKLMHVKPNFYHVRQVEPCHRLGEVAGRSSWAMELLVLYLNRTNSAYRMFALMRFKIKQGAFNNHCFPFQACNQPIQPFLRRLENWMSKTQKSMSIPLPEHKSFGPAELLSSIFPTLVRILKNRTKNLQVSLLSSNLYP